MKTIDQQEGKDELQFGYNWNNKLDCKYFTTIRAYNPEKYRPGNTHRVFLNKKYIFNASVMDMRCIKGKQLNPFICGLDTGYSVEETKEVLERMYKKDIEEMSFSLVLYKKNVA